MVTPSIINIYKLSVVLIVVDLEAQILVLRILYELFVTVYVSLVTVGINPTLSFLSAIIV